MTGANREDAFNFGHKEHVKHAERYDRAEEFADVVLGLWDSFEDDAFLRDKRSGRFFDPAKLHVLESQGGAFLGAWTLERSALAARPPRAHPGRKIGARA